MIRARTIAAIAAIASLVGVGGYLLRDEHKPAAHHRAQPAVVAETDPEPAAPADPGTTQARLVTPPSPAVPAQPAAAPDERSIMSALRSLGPEDAERVLQLARAGNARFPNSPDAAERSWTIVKALTTLQRFHEARDEAQLTVQRYPGTTWAQDVERHLLVHPLDLPSREEQQELDREEKELEDFRATLGAR
ncbi:MAG: hypothetical protein ABUL62_28680 [Myxococcales bacterium]